MYIGRYDDSISIYRMSDELLVGLNNWKAPKYPETCLCGFRTIGKMLSEIHLDLRDRQTLYVCGDRDEGLLSTPIKSGFNLHDSVFSAILDSSNRYSIYNERGEPVEAKFWPLQKEIRVQDCRVFL